MSFSGFTIPDGAYIPPELIYLLPQLSGSETKILLAVIYHNLQIGGGEAISLSDIQNLTGLSRQTTTSTLARLRANQLLIRHAVNDSFAYSPVVKFLDYPSDQVVKKLDYPVKKLDQSAESLRESDRELIKDLNIKDSSDSSDSTGKLDSQKIYILKQLRSCGVYLKTAQGLINQHSQAEIEIQLAYYRYALTKNLAQGPGWLVMAIKEAWPAPLGYQDVDRPTACPYCSGPAYGNDYLHHADCPTLGEDEDVDQADPDAIPDHSDFGNGRN